MRKRPCNILPHADGAGMNQLEMMEAVRMIALRESFKRSLLAGLRAGETKPGLPDRHLPMHVAQWRLRVHPRLPLRGQRRHWPHSRRMGRTGFPFQLPARLRRQYQKQC